MLRAIGRLLIAILLVVPATPGVGQMGPPRTLPFRAGERLVYDVKLSRFPIVARVGRVTFSVSQPAGAPGLLRFQVDAVSRGALVELFGVSVEDSFVTLADAADLYVYTTIKNLHEGEWRRRQEAVFTRNPARVRYAETNPADPNSTPAVTEGQALAWQQDIVSAVYYARTLALPEDGSEVVVPINDEGKPYQIGVAMLGRARVKTPAGEFAAIAVDGRIFNGRFSRKEGRLTVWLSDDERRVPVKAQVKLAAGTVTFQLEAFTVGDQPPGPSKPTRSSP